jgi:hypothetical protein
MKYVFLFCSTADEQRAWESMPEDQRNEAYGRIGQWFAENGDKIQGGYELQGPDTATTIRQGQDGQPVVTDGPYIEGKEIIGGYAEVEAEDLDDALRLARTWPGFAVEVRPVVAQ